MLYMYERKWNKLFTLFHPRFYWRVGGNAFILHVACFVRPLSVSHDYIHLWRALNFRRCWLLQVRLHNVVILSRYSVIILICPIFSLLSQKWMSAPLYNNLTDFLLTLIFSNCIKLYSIRIIFLSIPNYCSDFIW